MDDILFLNDILICQSQGNTSLGSRPEAWAKNIVSVGGVTHQDTLDRADDNWQGYSSGPADDGRVKPDLSHFADSVFCPDASSTSGYSDFAGTSAATPIVAGSFGLLFQMWHQGLFPPYGQGPSAFADRPHMATAKALMINSAFRYNWLAGGANAALTRMRQGWGMPDLARLYNDSANTFVVNEEDYLLQGASTNYSVPIAEGAPEFRATMVYTDQSGSVAASVDRVNDLSMKVTAPGGTIYWGNHGLIDGNYSTAGGSSDTINTVENVFIQNPQAGPWTITIYADLIAQDAHFETFAVDADYALVVVPLTFCPADIVHDRTVNINDLNAVITKWGVTGPSPADVNHDNVVNIDDLVFVINHYGPCS